LFPLGKTNEFRWIELKNASGNFLVEFIPDDGRNLSTSCGAGVNHISSHGYWSINADASPTPSAKVELSFANASGSGVTDMATLKAAQLISGIWVDRNNTSTTGTAGAAGSVVSELINSFAATPTYFALASSVPNENPLHILLSSFSARKENNEIRMNWDIDFPDEIDYFEIWYTNGDTDFEKLSVIKPVSNQAKYEFSDTQPLNGIRYYKLRVVAKTGDSFFSKIISVKNGNGFKIISIAPSVVYNNAMLTVYTNERTQLEFILANMEGKVLTRRYFSAGTGKNTIPCNFSGLASGVYILSCFNGKGNIGSVRFIKL
jgi:hypothetical protein